MTRNIGIFDLVIRSVFGLGLLAYLAKDGVFAPGSGPGIFIGAYLVVTGIFMYCPLYRVLGVSTFGHLDRLI